MTTTVSVCRSPFAIPSSIAARTSSQPPDWAAALAVATRTRPRTSSRRPVRYRPRRLRPVRLCDTDLVSEEVGKEGAPLEQVGGAAVLDHAPVVEHRRAVGPCEGGKARGGDDDVAAGERRTQPPDQVVLRMRVDGRQRVVEDDHAGARDQGAGER